MTLQHGGISLYFTGKVIRINKLGKIRIPINIFRKIKVDVNTDEVEIYRKGEQIVLKKYLPVCFVTGKESSELKELLPGMLVSEEGMHQLLDELESQSLD
ncbi:transition state regulator Abh [Psychrobacillus sp. MER TA 171]|nr:transition state regulator Abh [Psychrobacillus sp. MER TA 171]